VDFGFNDEQSEIKSTAREFLASRFKPEKVRELAESESPYDEGIWKEMCELGWPGIAISEEYGGQGLGLVELVILLEEMGYALAPSPFISNAFAGYAIEGWGSEEQKSRWLPGIASGEARGAAAFTPEIPPIVGAAKGAAVLVLPTDEGGRLVEADNAELERLDLVDRTRAYFRVSASGGDPLEAEAAYVGMVALAAESVGVAQRALDMAVDYAKEREQFGRPIGAYQAVSHRCAQMLYDTEEARSLVLNAAWCGDAEPDSLPLAAHMAKARASDAAVAVTNAALQVFGGIGFTWEHDLHFFLKRAQVSAQLLGTAAEHRERVAELIGLAEPAAVA
jgi:alkylation response protein AidB-like acyl-CoA dehydrogenase